MQNAEKISGQLCLQTNRIMNEVIELCRDLKFNGMDLIRLRKSLAGEGTVMKHNKSF